MPSTQLLFGPMLIGAFVNAILYGVMVVQMFIYHQTYKRDATWMKLFIVYLFIVETLNTGFNIAMMYEPLVAKFGTEDAITFFPMFLAADPLLTVIISTPIQIFIAWRIKIISRATWLTIGICILAIISFGGGIWLTVTVMHIRRFARKPDLHWPALMWLLASAIADVTITVSLSMHLRRRKTGFSGTDDVINRIIRLTIQTGFVTAVFATLDVVCFLALPHTTINFVFDFTLSKLYTNALMSTLNARSGWGNLINGASPENDTIFVDGSQVPPFQTFSARNFRNPNMLSSTGTYEMDTSLPGVHKSRSDIEYAISITKEVNTVSDPPDNRNRSTQ